MKDIQSALGWCLLGMLLTQLLINLIGFASPFWGLWLHDGDPYASRNLLRFWQPIIPWFSVCYLVASWHIAKTIEATVARIGVITMGAAVVAVEIGSSFARRTVEQAESPISAETAAAIDAFSKMYLGLAALVFLALIWGAVRKSNNSFKPNPLRGSA